MRHSLALIIIASWAATSWAAPLIPTIMGHDFKLDSYNGDSTVEYATRGLQADTLTYTRNVSDHEVIGYMPNYPTPPVLPVFDLGGNFGGDFVLNVQFTGQDAPIGALTVSLTGTGANAQGADLEIWGQVTVGSTLLSGRLWALDLDQVSLYGYANSDSYVVEGVGTILDCAVAAQYGLLGARGAVRGHLDFVNRPQGWVPAGYNPVTDSRDIAVRAGYSAETGLIPEPASLGLLLVGLGTLMKRR